jgi:hypothetical protein
MQQSTNRVQARGEEMRSLAMVALQALQQRPSQYGQQAEQVWLVPQQPAMQYRLPTLQVLVLVLL